jgi:XRE family transcriptional regulator, regulator of sulfur utilization
VNTLRLVNSDEPPRVGRTLQSLRQAQDLSLDDLSRKAGVSKSMLSQIERNLANPTIALVWRLANALGVSIGDLLGSKSKEASLSLVPTHAIPSLTSSDGKCVLRILGPLESAGQFEWYELTLQPAGVLDSQPHEEGSREHLTVLSGAVEIQAGTESVRARKGETARYSADVPHSIRNSNRLVAVVLLVVVHGPMLA